MSLKASPSVSRSTSASKGQKEMASVMCSVCTQDMPAHSYLGHLEKEHPALAFGVQRGSGVVSPRNLAAGGETKEPVGEELLKAHEATKADDVEELQKRLFSKSKKDKFFGGPGFVYVLSDQATGEIKIGKASDVVQRLREASTYNRRLLVEGIFFSLGYDLAETNAHTFMEKWYGRRKLPHTSEWSSTTTSEWFLCKTQEALEAARDGCYSASIMVWVSSELWDGISSSPLKCRTLETDTLEAFTTGVSGEPWQVLAATETTLSKATATNCQHAVRGVLAAAVGCLESDMAKLNL